MTSCAQLGTGSTLSPEPDEDLIDTEGGRGTPRRVYTAREYAKRVLNHSRTTAAESLYPGESFRPLADFLWQPYVSHAPPLTEPPNTSGRPCCFASIYQPGNKGLSRVSLETVESFEELGDDAIIPAEGSFAFLCLHGYPSAEWVNALGGRLDIDPEFFQRHVLFASESGRSISKQPAGPTLPSIHGDMVSLRITTIGKRQNSNDREQTQDELDLRRRETSEKMINYLGKMSSLNCPGIAPGDSIVRDFSVHGFDYFSVEQSVSISIHTIPGAGWIGIVWQDCGRPLDEGITGPWRAPAIRSNSFEVKYLPIAVHKPRIALKSRKRKASTAHQQPQNSVQNTDLIFEDYGRHIDLTRAAHDPFYAISPFLAFAVSSEMGFLDTVDFKIRDELDHFKLISPDNPSLSNLLYYQQLLKRHIRHIREPMKFMEGLAERDWFRAMRSEAQSHCAESIELFIKDYRAAFEHAEGLAAECVQGIGIVAHSATIQESQKAIMEARGVTRLTRLAVVFVPLTFVTSIFGMNVQELGVEKGPSLWVWSVASITLGLLTLTFFLFDLRKLLEQAGQWMLRGWHAVVPCLRRDKEHEDPES